MLRNLDPLKNQKIGLRDSRMVLFNNDTQMLWTTTFETDWEEWIHLSMHGGSPLRSLLSRRLRPSGSPSGFARFRRVFRAR